MNDVALAFATDYGAPVLFVVTFLSCLALPVPSSLLMLASGGFAATGDMSLIGAMLAAFTGAILGDNTGYGIAKLLGTRLTDWLTARPRRRALRDRAVAYMDKWGGISIFFSRWLVAPLGPYVNYACGLADYPWPRFALWSAAGEIVWVCTYVGLGYLFADNITAISGLLGNLSGFLAACVVAIGLLVWIRKTQPQRFGRKPRDK